MLAEKPYRKITVGDILQEADVSRSTFYTHFETKDALLAEICADLFAHVGSADAQEDSSLWRNEHNEEVPEDLFCAHITATFIECARWWYAQGLEESPELIERLFESLI